MYVVIQDVADVSKSCFDQHQQLCFFPCCKQMHIILLLSFS